MHSEVFGGRSALLSIESEQACANAGKGSHVNPIVCAGCALKGPQHAARESNRRAGAALCAHALKSAERRAAVGEG